jgi:hypothetical protein
VIAFEQMFTTASPYQGNYQLQLFVEQYCFPTEDQRDAFLQGYRDHLIQSRPGIVITDVESSESKRAWAFERSLGGARGTLGGFAAVTAVDSFAGFAAFDVSLVAFPGDPAPAPVPAQTLTSELSPTVNEITAAIEECLVSPEMCPATALLQANPIR